MIIPIFQYVALIVAMALPPVPKDTGGYVVEVTSEQANIKSKQETIATVPQGTRLWVFELKGTDWAMVKVPETDQRGWILQSQLKQPLYYNVNKKIREIERLASSVRRYTAREQWNDAARSAEKRLELITEIFGDKDMSTVDGHSLFAFALRRKDNGDSARFQHEKALDILRWFVGTHHPTMSTCLNNYALFEKRSRNYLKSMGLYKKALAVDLKISGENSTETATTLNNMGRLAGAMNDHATAVEHLSRALEIRMQLSGNNSSSTQVIRENLADARANLNAIRSRQPLRERFPMTLPEDLSRALGVEPTNPTLPTKDEIRKLAYEIFGVSGNKPRHSSLSELQQQLMAEVPERWVPKSFMPAVTNIIRGPRSLAQDAREKRNRLITSGYPADPKKSLEYDRIFVLLLLAENSRQSQQVPVDYGLLAGDARPRSNDTRDNKKLWQMTKPLGLLGATEALNSNDSRARDCLLLALELMHPTDTDSAAAMLEFLGEYAVRHGELTRSARCYRLAVLLHYINASRWDMLINSENPRQVVQERLRQQKEGDEFNLIWQTYTDLVGTPHFGNLYRDLLISDGAELAARLSETGQLSKSHSTILAIKRLGIDFFGERGASLAKVYEAEAQLYRFAEDHRLSRRAIETAMDIQERSGLRNSQAYVVSQLGLANAFANLGEYDSAIVTQKEALSRATQLLSGRSRFAASSEATLGAYLIRSGDFQEALKVLSIATPNLAGIVSSNDPELIPALTNLGHAQCMGGEYASGAENLKKSMQCLVRYCLNEASQQDTATQLRFLQEKPRSMSDYAFGILYSNRNVPVVGRTLAESLLNTRGLILRSLAGKKRQPRSTVGKESVHRHGKHPDPWVALTELNLAKGEAVVLYCRANWALHSYEVEQKIIDQYLACVLRTGHEPLFVELGDAKMIDIAIQQALEEASRPGDAAACQVALRKVSDFIVKPILDSISAAETWIISPEGSLWSIPFACLFDNQGTYLIEKHDIIYFNSPTHLQAKTLGEQSLAMASSSVTPALVLFDPDFDANQQSVGLEAAPLVRGLSSPPRGWGRLPGTKVEIESSRAAMAAYLGRSVDELSAMTHGGAAATETRVWSAESPHILAFATHGYYLTPEPAIGFGVKLQSSKKGLEITELVRGGAAERQGVLEPSDILVSAAEKNGGKQVKFLDMAAFELKPSIESLKKPVMFRVQKSNGKITEHELTVGPLYSNSLILQTGSDFDNPLNRCGLVLAGANASDADTNPMSDGFLTGAEATKLQLDETQLVVLSACETGRGDTVALEGAVGLRHAFQEAGASAVLAALWSIPDEETAKLQQLFWKHLAEESSPHAALAKSQRDMISLCRQEIDRDHPFFWAAFTVTGRALSRQYLSSHNRDGGTPGTNAEDKALAASLATAPERKEDGRPEQTPNDTSPSVQVGPLGGEGMTASSADIVGQVAPNDATVLVDSYLTSRNGKLRFYRIPSDTNVSVIKQTGGMSQVSFERGGRTLKGWISTEALQRK